MVNIVQVRWLQVPFRAAITAVAMAIITRGLFAAGDHLPSDSPMFVVYSFVALLYGLTALIAIVLALPGPDPGLLIANSLAGGLGVAIVNFGRPADINQTTRVLWWFVVPLVAFGGSLAVAAVGYGLARHLARQRTAGPNGVDSAGRRS